MTKTKTFLYKALAGLRFLVLITDLCWSDRLEPISFDFFPFFSFCLLFFLYYFPFLIFLYSQLYFLIFLLFFFSFSFKNFRINIVNTVNIISIGIISISGIVCSIVSIFGTSSCCRTLQPPLLMRSVILAIMSFWVPLAREISSRKSWPGTSWQGHMWLSRSIRVSRSPPASRDFCVRSTAWKPWITLISYLKWVNWHWGNIIPHYGVQ